MKMESAKRVETEKGMEAENPLAVLQEKILTWTIKEITPFGIKHEFNTEGKTVGELYSAQHIETANVYIKYDGGGELEARAIEITKEGEDLVLSYKGTGKRTGTTTIEYETQAFIVTSSPRLAQLNNLRIRTKGFLDIATRDITIKYYMP
jgi:hypothetical protein